MNKLNFKHLACLLAIGFFSTFTACHKSNDDFNNNGSQVTPAAGTWKITYFFDKKEETSFYTNIQFEFGANGTLTATANGQTYSGTWISGYDDSHSKFLIQWTAVVPSILQELSEDWRIIEMTATRMHFEHTSGGNGDTDILIFEKI